MEKFIIKLIGFYLNFIAVFSPKKAADLAIRIFSKPRKGQPTGRQTDFLNTADRHILNYGNNKIMTYCWKGSKDAVLLAHGWESNAGRWKGLIKQLTSMDHTVIAMDAPAHGQTDGKSFNAILYADFMKEVVKTYGPKTVIGHSVGGMAFIFLVYWHGNLGIKKLAALGSPAHFKGVLERYVKLMGYSGRVASALDKLILERFGHKPDYYSGAEFMKDFNLDVLIIHDKGDSIIPYDDALLYKEKYPAAELITTTGLGHGLKDNAVYDRILTFINAG